MALTPEARHRLYNRLEEVLGVDHAAALRWLFPPEGWGDVARHRDLDHVEERISARIDGAEERLGLRIDGVEERLGLRIDGVEERLGLRIDGLEERFAERLNTTEQRLARHVEERINAAITTQTRTMLISMTVFMGSFAGLAFSLR